MPYDFPSGVPTGTVVTVPDGSYRVWDSQKWRAAPSPNVIIPPTGYLPLIGGSVSGILNLVDPGGALWMSRHNTFSGVSSDAINRPIVLQQYLTGTNLDGTTTPPGGFAYYSPTAFNTDFTGFVGAGHGTRTAQFWSQMGPGHIGTTTALGSTITQTSPHPPGTNKWAPNTAYAVNYAMTNNFSAYVCTVAGTSASSGIGPNGYSTSITDGTAVWSYLGPGVPRYWAPSTSYPNKGEMVTNPNNGGLFTVETPGVSGAFPGPVRNRAAFAVPARLATTGNLAALSGLLVIDGVQTVQNDRVLVKAQTDQTQNGIYVVNPGAWVRATDADQWFEVFSRWLAITEGVVQSGLPAGTGYLCTSASGGTIGTTPMVWTQSLQPTNTAISDGTVVWALRTIGSAAQFYIGGGSNATSSFNVGGKGPNESVGHQWGGIIGSTITPNATWFSESVALEIDDRMTGSSRKVVALQVVRAGNQGLFTDVGIILNVGPGWPGYRTAFQLSNSTDRNYGYAMKVEGFGAANYQHMAGCIDTRMVKADGTQGPFGSGFIFRHPNGMLDQFGAWQMRYGSITPTASGLTIDVTNVELQSIAITPGNGGANWLVGGGWKSSDGAWGVVRTVDGTGAILTVQISLPSQVPAPGPATITLSPFNADSVLNALGDDPDPGTVGPTGDVIWPTPATGTPTYAAPATPTLSLMPSGGTVQIGAGCIAANGSVATVLGSLGPVGSHTAVQEWIAVKNASGVTRYIPAF